MNTTRRQSLQTLLIGLPASVLAQPVGRSNTGSETPALPFTAVIPESFPPATRALAYQWLARSARALTDYLGRFPAPQAVITLVPGEAPGVRAGVTFDAPPASIRVVVGIHTPPSFFLADWVMVHEMMHLAISQLPRRHNWFHEGAATYVEIMARAHSGLTTTANAWDQLMRNAHHGLPLADEGGMDGTQRWGRLYWGGALFCWLADLDIRRQTQNRLGLQDAFAGMVRAGSHYGERWGMERTLQVADSAVGTAALSSLYQRFKDTAVTTDLPQLFADLGLRRTPNGLQVLDDAPLASARRAILPE